MQRLADIGLAPFLALQPGMSLRPSDDGGLIIKGEYSLHAVWCGETISDLYDLKIVVPRTFPADLPQVYDLVKRIPRTKEGLYHVNSDDSLCLGSPLRLMMLLKQRPDLCGFSDLCLTPYLFAITKKIREGGPLVFSELAHATVGLLQDYRELLGLADKTDVSYALSLAGKRKRIANKMKCPCGCGLRLGWCEFHHRINGLRKVASRPWFRRESAALLSRDFAVSK